MQKDDLQYYLAFSYCFGIGPMTFKIIQHHPLGVRGVYGASAKELLPIFNTKLTEKFVAFRNRFNPEMELERLTRAGVEVLSIDSDGYPESLKNISDPPICLYIKGDSNLFNARHHDFSSTSSRHGGTNKSLTQNQVPSRSIKNSATSLNKNDQENCATFFAIVGTRKPTSYGIQVTKKFAYELAEAGLVIVSGLAMGIDTIAHQAALDAGGNTVAVLGCGVNIIYPAVNRKLYEDIIKSGGAIISEFPPDQMVIKGLFISRNRIISGLSTGVLITEGLQDSGALITARFAGEQGKEVFAVPSPITSAMSIAPNFLLKQGAKLVTSTNDIYEDLNMKVLPRQKEDIQKTLNETEKIIYNTLEKTPQTIDNLAILFHKMVQDVLNVISVMEINGIIEKNQEKKYQVKL